MNTGQRLVALSPLPSATALAHLLALTTGTGGTGATVFAQRLVVSSTEARARVFSRPQTMVQPPVLPPSENIASKGKNVFVMTPVMQHIVRTTDNTAIVLTNKYTRSN